MSVRMSVANLSNLNKLPNTRVFVAAENGSVEVPDLVALFLRKTGTFSAKKSEKSVLGF